MARAFRAWAVNRRRINLVSKLRYGPQTRLVRGIYGFITLEKKLRYILIVTYVNLVRPPPFKMKEILRKTWERGWRLLQ